MRGQVFSDYYQVLLVDLFSNTIKSAILMRNHFILPYFKVTHGVFDCFSACGAGVEGGRIMWQWVRMFQCFSLKVDKHI